MNCPKCRAEIPNTNINIQTDMAHCFHCGHIYKISESIHISAYDNFNISEPPKGAWYQHDFDTTTIGASTQSLAAFFLVPFMLVWSGISLGGIYGSQIIRGEFNLGSSLFGIPFILGSIFFWGMTLMTIFGKIELTFNQQGGKVFTGIGKLGFTKNFEWQNIDRIIEADSKLRYPGKQGSQGKMIVFEGKKRLSFGTGLKDEREYYLLQALRKIHSEIKNNFRKNNSNTSTFPKASNYTAKNGFFQGDIV